MSFEKVSDMSIKETVTTEKTYDITEIERMIQVYKDRIVVCQVEQAKWEVLKSEADKLGVKSKPIE